MKINVNDTHLSGNSLGGSSIRRGSQMSLNTMDLFNSYDKRARNRLEFVPDSKHVDNLEV